VNRLPLLPDIPRPLVFAHRGVSSIAPENTMAAYRLARTLGIPGIELDVHLCADGKLVVIHDHFTGRTTGAGGAGGLPPGPAVKSRGLELERSTWADLRALDVGSWKGPEYAGERMPLLPELFEELGSAFYWDIEIKSNIAADYGLETAVARAIRDAGLVGRCLVSSFNPVSLARFKALEPDVPTAIIWCSDEAIPFYLRHGEGRWLGRVDALKPEHVKVHRASSFRWRKIERYPVLTWAVDDAAGAARMLRLGCEGVISNCPQELELLRARNRA
jgi:glycerophosphoryl diester phosphodiesterase